MFKKTKKLKQEDNSNVYNPVDREKEILEFVDNRVHSMQEHRKNILGKNIDEGWKQADNEYLPEASDTSGTVLGGRALVSDDETGLRSRLVSLASLKDDWKANVKTPTLFVKIQTALSIIIDKSPEAFFKPISKRYEAATKIAYACWKSSWETDTSTQQVKLFAFNLMKYGWAIGRTYPKILKRKKDVLISYDTENPEKNEYESKEITDFNGIHRENLDPYRTWIDEMTTPYDANSTNDWYFEKDYDYDTAALEFGRYPNWKYVKHTSTVSSDNEVTTGKDERGNIITVGFYENKNKDLSGIKIPNQKILLHACPLPNDDGKLSCWQTLWYLRDSRTPYGLSLWEVIKGNKQLFDKMNNMTMDQLVLSIYKMFFFTGTNSLTGDEKIEIEPGKGVQNLGGTVDWMTVPGPGKEAWDGLKYLSSTIDDITGITPSLQGEVTGQTLGEILHARESALKRMNVPIDNIAWALSQEAYISLSWIKQIYSVPEVKEFATEQQLFAYEKESGLESEQINQSEDGSVTASFYKELPLKLEKNNDRLIETKENQFFQIGKDIKYSELRWEGIINVIPSSILSVSNELEKQRKLEVFNLIVPLLGQPPDIYSKAVKQILNANDEQAEDWLPANWVEFLINGPKPPSIFVDQQQQGGTTKPGQTDNSNRDSAQTMQESQKLTMPEMNTIVPQGQINSTSTQEIAGGMQ